MARFRFGADWKVLLILSLVPLALFVYLGTQSRLIGDDYGVFVISRELGPWETMLYRRNEWTASYSEFFVHGLFVPLQETAPRIMPAFIIIIWNTGLVWLFFRALALLKIHRHRPIISIVFAAFIAGATVNAIISPLSIYYFTGSVRYLLPIALLTLYTAANLHFIGRTKSRRQIAVAVFAGSLFSFFNAGFSEMYLIYQLAFLSLALAAVYVIMRSERRRAALVFFGGGWLASVASLLIQLTAPAVGIRRAYIQGVVGVTNDSIAVLTFKSIGQALQLVYDSEIFAGFMLLFFLSLYTTLTIYHPSKRSEIPQPIKFTRPLLLFGLVAQLLCILLVYPHTSDLPQVLGRYSYAYSTVLIINGGLLLVLGILLVVRSRINVLLERYQPGGSVIAVATLLILLFLFSLTQIRPIHWRGFAFLLISCHVLLVMLTWQLSQKMVRRRFATYMICAYGASLALNTAVILPELYTDLKIIPRTLTMLPYCMVLHGLLWGVLVGYAVKQREGSYQAKANCITMLRSVSFCAVLVISVALVGRNMQLVPPFETFAREWDARQDHIIAQRDSGQRQVTVAPLSFDLGDYMKQVKPFHIDPHAPRYYDVDVIIVE